MSAHCAEAERKSMAFAADSGSARSASCVTAAGHCCSVISVLRAAVSVFTGSCGAGTTSAREGPSVGACVMHPERSEPITTAMAITAPARLRARVLGRIKTIRTSPVADRSAVHGAINSTW
jgi:hypothetical protein